MSRRSFLRAVGLGGCGLTASASYLARASVGLSLPAVAAEKAKAVAVPTMTGSIPCDTLGTTLMHEHVLYGEIPEDLHSDSVDFAVNLLNDAVRVGVHTVVDLTPVRNIGLYQEIARRTSARIMASTGSYIYRRMPKWLKDMNERQMEERIFREVADGIDGTKVRAGIIKVAGTRSPLTDWEKSAFRAAARVQKATKVPIGTHAIFEPWEQFDLLVKAGADPNRVFLSHIEAEFGWAGRSREQMAEYLTAIAKEGGYLLFNNFGFEFDTPWEDLVYLIRFLCDKGYARRVFTSVDCNWEWKDRRIVFEAEEKHPQTRNRTLAYMITDAVPAMLKAGFSAKEIHTFLVDNPRRFFCGS